MSCITDVTVHIDSNVYTYKVTIFYNSFFGRNSMDYFVVDTDTGSSREVFAPPGRLSTMGNHIIFKHIVYLLCRHSGVNLWYKFIKHVGSNVTYFADAGNLFWCFELNHKYIVTLCKNYGYSLC